MAAQVDASDGESTSALEALPETLRKVDELILVEDPEGEPFRSKYEALRLLCAAQELLQSCGKERGADLRDVLRRIGGLHLATEDFAAAEEALRACVESLTPTLVERITKLSGDDVDEAAEVPTTISLDEEEARCLQGELETVWDCLNLLGLLWSQRDRPRRSLLFLLVAEELGRRAGVSHDDSPEDAKLLSLLNHTVYYLAQVYANLGESDRAAKYVQTTLEHQLITRDSFSPLEWAKNCMGLADFCLARRRFLEASRCLQASKAVINSAGDEVLMEDEGRKAGVLADLQRRWATLAAELLQAVVDENYEAEPLRGGDGPRRVEFRSLPAEPVPILLTPREIVTFDSAREIFLFGEKASVQALAHYELDGYVTDHIRLLQLRSRLLNLLSRFEKDAARVAAMHTKRCGMLAPLLAQLSPTHYAHLLKEISFEVGSIQSDLVDFRAKRVEKRQRQGKSPKQGDVVALNRAAAAAIMAFESFSSYYQKPQPGCCRLPTYSSIAEDEALGDENRLVVDGVVFPPLQSMFRREGPRAIDYPHELHESDVGPLWRAHFHVARMWGRTVSPTPKQRVEVLSQALQLYECLPELATGLIERIDKAEAEGVTEQSHFGQELDICRQMAELLPAKISRVHYDGDTALGPSL